MSFLKETRGLLTWTIKDLQKSLLIGATQAREVIAALGLQAYVKQAENPHEWLTTINGEAVSGSNPPRFSREAVEKSLAALRERIKFINKDSGSPYKIAQAVAFGDFLRGSAQGPSLPTWGCRLWDAIPPRNAQVSTNATTRRREFARRTAASFSRIFAPAI